MDDLDEDLLYEDIALLRGALQEILAIAELGVPPDYGKWLSTYERIAEIAKRALSI